jgi:hypothetical protein
MDRSLPLAVFCAILLAAPACSSTPPAEQPTTTPNDQEQAPPDAEGDPASQGPKEEEATTAAPMGTVKTDPKDDTIPDDYTMLDGDCMALGGRLAAVVRADHMAQLSPKLAEDKRAKAEENINDVAEKLSTQWINGCKSSLVGKVVERERLKCALESRTMKAFEECINPPVEKK